LAEAAYWLVADAAELGEDWTGAVQALEFLAAMRSLTPARVQLRLGQAAARAGDRNRARGALERVYFEFAPSPEADEAADALSKLGAAPRPTPATLSRALARADELYAARRYADARKAFAALRGVATGEDRLLVNLRLAECDFHVRRYAAARDALRTYLGLGQSAPRQDEARFFYISALRELGRHAEYVALARAFVEANPEGPFAQKTLNDLGTHYILIEEDAAAAAVFAEVYRRFPTGPYSDRAAWKSGWWAYKAGDYAEAIRVFESAAVTFRRADYRPSWLYWAARARAEQGDRDGAIAGFHRVVADYRNSYYGRRAVREVEALAALMRPAGAGPVLPVRRTPPPAIATGTPPPNAGLISRLLSAGLYDDAVLELRRIQLESGPSPYLDATVAFALNQKGELRPAITAMRRAYPQFMAEGGETLPREILTIIFPLDFWDLISRHAAAHGLDPFLMTALVAQESTFDPAIRSAANAWGLMQIVPATGRTYARKLGLRGFSTARLTNPETNVRIGMSYFADLLAEFGDVAQALAAYNAGEHRVVRWIADRPGVDQDEFIDDIPFPETQNYVKRILGTADDYRILYGRLTSAR
jgi:soluble lytic murein transglycosylase